MEDQVLSMDSFEEVTSEENPFKKLLKKEQRLTAKLQEEQEAEARAQDRFHRAKTRLQRRRKRVERIQGKLVLVREQLADLQITDQQPVNRENEIVIVSVPASTTQVDSNEVTPIQLEQNNVVAQESDDFSAAYIEYPAPNKSESDQESQEHTSIDIEMTDIPAVDGNEDTAQEQEISLPKQETPLPTPFTNEPIKAIAEPEREMTLEERDDREILAPETKPERKPTKPLRLEQPELPDSSSHASDIQSAKEAWIAAESAMQHIRNASNGIATSISFLSQTDGLSNEFMEELMRKQADANRELLKAQDAARVAYERFIQAQRDAQPATSQPMNTSGGNTQQKQEDASLPPAEENGLDQTAKLHAIRLYSEW